MLRTLDINETHQLALVEDIDDDELKGAHYETLSPRHQLADDSDPGVYLRQYHAVANTVTVGLVAGSRGIPQDGWKRLEQLQAMSRKK